MTEKIEPLCGVDWLREICEKAGKGCLPPNVDARGVLRTLDGALATITALKSENEKLRNELIPFIAVHAVNHARDGGSCG